MLGELRGRWSRFRLLHQRRLAAISVSFAIVGYVFGHGMTPFAAFRLPLDALERGGRPDRIALTNA